MLAVVLVLRNSMESTRFGLDFGRLVVECKGYPHTLLQTYNDDDDDGDDGKRWRYSMLMSHLFILFYIWTISRTIE
jgi:hypothetical protein